MDRTFQSKDIKDRLRQLAVSNIKTLQEQDSFNTYDKTYEELLNSSTEWQALQLIDSLENRINELHHDISGLREHEKWIIEQHDQEITTYKQLTAY